MNSLLWRGLRRFFTERQASTAVETALAFPIVLAIGAVCADIYTVALEREHLEQRAGAISAVLGLQQSLTGQGLQGLLDQVMPESGAGDYHLLLSNVRQNGEVYWQLSRGTSDELCNDNQTTPQAIYPGSLPEKDTEEGQAGISMIVVELCRQGKNISLAGGLSLNNLLDVTSINRVSSGVITLDKSLSEEAGVADDDDE